jgi:hypothetical protein
MGATGGIAMNQLLQIDEVLALQSTTNWVPSGARSEFWRLLNWRTQYEDLLFAPYGHRAGSHPD